MRTCDNLWNNMWHRTTLWKNLWILRTLKKTCEQKRKIFNFVAEISINFFLLHFINLNLKVYHSHYEFVDGEFLIGTIYCLF